MEADPWALIKKYKYPFLIIGLGIIVFFNMLFNGFVGDDQSQIIDNPIVHSFNNIPFIFLKSTFNFGGDFNSGIYYKPIMSLFFTLLYTLFGPNAFPFHLLQLCLHIINAFLVFLIFRYFFNKKVAFFLSLVFLVHPINTEAVAYVSDLQDILFFFFGCLAFLLELRVKNTLKKTILVSFLLLLSLFSKETGVLFIAAIFCYELLFHKDSIKRTILPIIAVVLTYIFFRVGLAGIVFKSDSASPIQHISLGQRLFNVPFILLFYLKTAFFPIHLAVAQTWIKTTKNMYDFFVSVAWLSLILVIFAFVGVFLYRNYKKYIRIYVFFLSILILGLLFHGQIFFALDATVAERWFYFPILGLLGVIGTLLTVYEENIKGRYKNVALILGIIIIALLSIRTMVRNTNFVDNYTLYSHDIKYSTQSSLLYSGLGSELMTRGEYAKAEPYLIKSIQLEPKGAVVWNTLGVLYERMGQIDKARQAYATSVKNGFFTKAYDNYALFLLLYDSPQTAEKFVQQSLQKFPEDGFLWQEYALIEHHLEHGAIALDAAKRAAIYNPTTLTYTIYNRLLENQPVDIMVLKSGNHNTLQVCPPYCQ